MIRNLIANYVGTIWVTLIQLAVLPVYIKVLGIEAYGLIGVHATLTALAALTDLGISPALNREVARLSVSPDTESEIRPFFRSLEIVYWLLAVACVVAGTVFLAKPVSDWINPQNLSKLDVTFIVRLMLLQIGLQMVIGFYTGGLLGLQRHVLYNGINIAGITVRCAGAIALLLWVSPALDSLFYWLIASTAAQASVMAIILSRALPEGPSQFQFQYVKRIWRYATGVSGIVILSLILMQIDKIILSRSLPLAEFGYYAMATTIAITLSKPAGPLSRTLLPRMTQLAAQHDENGLTRLYHQGAQLASLLVFPTTAVLVAFSSKIMLLGLGDPETARAVAPLVSLLAAGYAGLTLMYIPYNLTLAYGWVRFAFYQQLVACTIMVPLTFLFVKSYGAIGGGVAWLTLTSGYVVFSLYFLHRRLLPGAYLSWYTRDTLPAAIVAAGSVEGFRRIICFRQGWWGDVGLVMIVLAVAFGLTALTLEHVREQAWRLVRAIRLRMLNRSKGFTNG